VYSSDIPALQDGPAMVPVLFGIFGGIAGMFVGDWWADRDCVETCGQTNIAALFLGGALGAMLGWLIGGGEIPEEPPPGRWP
jgi:fluoride ion exporter CrcB/FEX